jgi:hypothetical protein
MPQEGSIWTSNRLGEAAVAAWPERFAIFMQL